MQKRQELNGHFLESFGCTCLDNYHDVIQVWEAITAVPLGVLGVMAAEAEAEAPTTSVKRRYRGMEVVHLVEEEEGGEGVDFHENRQDEIEG